MRILPFALALLLPALAPAGEAAPKTLLAECGPLLFSDTLAQPPAEPAWKAAKANFGFTVSGEHASFRNVAVWSAARKADWEQTRAGLEAAK